MDDVGFPDAVAKGLLVAQFAIHVHQPAVAPSHALPKGVAVVVLGLGVVAEDGRVAGRARDGLALPLEPRLV